MSSVNLVIPFGVEVATRKPISVEDVDLAPLVYDEDRQIMMVRDSDTGSLVPWCKHSTGPTRVNSNTDGKQGPEYDDDYTED